MVSLEWHLDIRIWNEKPYPHKYYLNLSESPAFDKGTIEK